jgi:hypothetical protein
MSYLEQFQISKIFYKRLGYIGRILYLYYMRERLIALIIFLLVTDHPCRMRVSAIEIEPLSKIEICFRPR